MTFCKSTEETYDLIVVNISIGHVYWNGHQKAIQSQMSDKIHRESIQSGRRWKEQFQSALGKQFLEVTFGWLLFSSGVVLSYSKGRDSFQLLLWVVHSLTGGGNTCLFADHTTGSYAREKTSELVSGQSKWMQTVARQWCECDGVHMHSMCMRVRERHIQW